MSEGHGQSGIRRTGLIIALIVLQVLGGLALSRTRIGSGLLAHVPVCHSPLQGVAVVELADCEVEAPPAPPPPPPDPPPPTINGGTIGVIAVVTIIGILVATTTGGDSQDGSEGAESCRDSSASGRGGSNIIPVKLYRNGRSPDGSNPGPYEPKAEKDVQVDEGTQEACPSSDSAGWPRGVSTFDRYDHWSGQHIYSLGAGTVLPEGLAVIADGADRGGPEPPGHHTIFPTRKMPFAEYSNKVLGLPWSYELKTP